MTERSPKITGSRCVAKNHPLYFPDNTVKRGDVYVTAHGEWYADFGGITYAVHPPDAQQRVVVGVSRFGSPALKRIEAS